MMRAILFASVLLIMLTAFRTVAADVPPPAGAREVPQPVKTYLDGADAADHELVLSQTAVEEANRKVQDDLAKLQSDAELTALKLNALKLQQSAQALIDTIKLPEDLDWLPEIQAARNDADSARAAFQTLAPLASAISDSAVSDLGKARDNGGRMSRVADQIATLVTQVRVESGRAAETMRRLFADSATLVVSGGVSLGSYQAGFLYYYTLHLKLWDRTIRERFPAIQPTELGGRFRIATGSSAGSVNAFLSLAAGCRLPVRRPEDSPFYRTWIDIGVSGPSALANPAKVGVDAIFDKGALEHSIAVAAGMWSSEPRAGKQWTNEPCPSYLGVTATQVTPRYIQISGGQAKGAMDTKVSVQRQPEKFLIMFDPTKPDETGAPALGSYRLGSESLHEEVYPTLGTATPGSTPENQALKIGQLAELLKASASFPLAFAPEDVPITIWKMQADGKPAPYPSVGRFLDGGFLDNTPLRLALKITKKLGGLTTNYLFLKSDAELWRAPGRHEPLPIEPTDAAKIQASSKRPGSLMSEYAPFLSSFLNGASDIELTEALLDMEDMTPRPQYWIPGRGMPIAGEYLAHFSAFLERSFRDFDFYQGMVDAYRHLVSHSGRPEAAESENRTVFVDSAKFRCFIDYRKQLDTAAEQATGPKLCKASVSPEPGPSCHGAGVTQNLRALLKASAAVKYWECNDRPGGDQFSVFLDALHDDGFTYDEFAGGSVLTSDQVAEKLRDKIQTLAIPLFHEQDGASGGAVASLIGKTASNFYYYRPVSYWGVGIVGGLEVTHGLSFWHRRYVALKIEPAFRIAQLTEQHLDSAMPTVQEISYSSMVSVPLVLELPFNSVVQGEIGAGPCARIRWGIDGVNPFNPLNVREGLDTQGGVVFLQRMYASVGYTQYFDHCKYNNACEGTFAAYKKAPDPIELHSYDLRLAVGWRFLY